MSDNLENVNKKSISGLGLCVLFSIVFIVLVAIDQIIKQVIVKNIKGSGPVTVIKYFFYLHYAENTGSAFSMFADKPWGIYFLSGVSLVLGLVIMILMFIAARRSMHMISLAFCLLFSGAVGNLIDRVRLRYVVDYIRFDFGTFTFPIFNFADICAVVGTILLIFIIIFKSRYFEKFWNVLFKSKKNQIILDPEQEKEDKNAG